MQRDLGVLRVNGVQQTFFFHVIELAEPSVPPASADHRPGAQVSQVRSLKVTKGAPRPRRSEGVRSQAFGWDVESEKASQSLSPLGLEWNFVVQPWKGGQVKFGCRKGSDGEIVDERIPRKLAY